LIYIEIVSIKEKEDTDTYVKYYHEDAEHGVKLLKHSVGVHQSKFGANKIKIGLNSKITGSLIDQWIILSGEFLITKINNCRHS
jgi:hypothetical protein